MQPSMSKQWVVRDRLDADAARELERYSPVMRQILFNRGITRREDAEAYLNPGHPEEHNPYDLSGMQDAVSRLLQAVQNHEKIAVYGDYDADGVTATVLLVQALFKLGADVRPYIPNRFEEGYGLNTGALDDLAAEGIRLVVTVDCGVRSIPEASHAAHLGLDMIITDHHTCGEDLPQAVAVINPHQPGDQYPDKNLAGVGLSYKLAKALYWVRPQPGVRPEEWLDLVALGTVADMAPLVGENRHLVSRGLSQIRMGWRTGIRSLAQVAGKRLDQITSQDIGFVLAPRLNAAGRLDSALRAFNLLNSDDIQITGKLAQDLSDQNTDRQKLTADMQKAAEQMILADPAERFLAFASSEEFNPGIIGLAAARVMETFYRPAIIARINGETIRASCRSISGFHITDALDRCEDLLVMHGGHSAAAGFTVRKENLTTLLDRLETIAAEAFIDGELLRRKYYADVEVSLNALNFDLLADIDRLQPTGIGNPEAVFLSRGVLVREKRIVGSGGNHLSLKLAQPGTPAIKAIAFRMAPLYDSLPDRVDVLYHLERDEFRGMVGLQLRIKDIRPAEGI